MTVRVASYNLLHGLALPPGRSDATGGRAAAPPVADPDLLRAAVRELDADVVGLQEVDHDQPRSGHTDQTAEVAAALDAPHWRFVATLHGTPGGVDPWTEASADHHVHTGSDAPGVARDGPAYGVGLVSRVPVREWRVLRLRASNRSLPLLVPSAGGRPRVVRVPDEPRVALAAVLDGTHGPWTVVTTHLSFVPGRNVRQLRELARWAAGLPQPVVLAGDLNLPGPVPRLTVGWRPLARAATYPSARPRVQLDHLLGLGLPDGTVLRSHARRLAVSDHCALSVDLDL